MYDNTFWSKGGGPIVFAGIPAIEQALWDIKGKCLGVRSFIQISSRPGLGVQLAEDRVRPFQWAHIKK